MLFLITYKHYYNYFEQSEFGFISKILFLRIKTKAINSNKPLLACFSTSSLGIVKQ